MASKGGYDKFLKDINPFSFGIPRTTVLFLLLFIMSVTIGIASVSLINYKQISINFSYLAVNGAITGILAIMLPTLLTILIVKAVKRYIDTKYIFFISIIATISYSVFVLLGSIVYILTHNYATAAALILVGDASIFGWWFFAARVVLGQRKRAIILALIQPTLNILLYIPSSKFILTFATPFNLLLIKLYAGIFIFLIVSYAIIYLVDRPYNKNFGFHSFDAVSQMIQNWLFDVNISTPFGTQFGTPSDIRADTIVFKNQKGAIKSIFFAPDIHYGPSGTLAGSDFPYMLEHYSNLKYKVPTFVMHCSVDMDHNPISSSQFNQLRETFDNGIKNSRAVRKPESFSYTKGVYNNSKVIRLGFNDLSLVTLTRAPKVTEDVSLESSVLFNELLEAKFGTSILLDAHNSRYETAPKVELDGVKFNSPYANEYVKAIKALGKAQHKTKRVRLGVASTEIYTKLQQPIDIARGNLNIAVFQFNGFKYAIIQFNSNNALPTIRTQIVKHVKNKYKIDAELYTTDTHAVNSLEYNASNVLGRYTKSAKILSLVDQTMEKALFNMETVTVYHHRGVMKRFKVWGANVMENMLTVAKSVYGMTRILVPLIVVLGFLVAAWLILII
jgi:predicted neutral ceramidase superfamily lipid hydrolase